VRFETQDIEAHDGSSSYDNSALMGGISARYEFASGLALFGSAAYTENLPIIDDLGTPAYMTRPERSHTFELGGSYAASDVFTASDVLAVKVNYYDSRLWDVTSYTYGYPVSQPIDKVDTSGVEIEASYSLASGFYADINATIADGEEFRSGTPQRWRNLPADNARLTLGKRFGEALDVSWELVAANSGYNSDGSTEVAGYGVQNLRATYRPQDGVLKGTEVRFGIENAFDKQYQSSLSSRAAPGRNFKLTVAKTF
jgi:hemoglobin/transferrin/lactoferrin receptor protein